MEHGSHPTTVEYNGALERRLRMFWDDGSRTVPLPHGGELVVGRADTCAVRVPHESVSRKHCVLRCGQTIEVEDLGSANGTQLGGVRLEPRKRTRVAPGVAVQLGAALLVWEAVASPTQIEPGGEHLSAAVVVPGSRLTEVLAKAAKYARGDLSILIEGETGAGKEIVAGYIQGASPRARQPYVKINCAALPENLLESELMGYERGAFTGATHSRPGLLEVACGGTLLLDEVGELPLGLQAKLLRVVDNQEVLRVGGRAPRRVNVRFISATNRSLEERVAEKLFRADLFFRLAGARLQLPPLCERGDEVLPLARHFLREHCQRLGLPEPLVGASAAELIRAHRWPGNVRELRSTMERALLGCEGGEIEPVHLSLPAASPAPSAPPTSQPSHELSEVEAVRTALAGAGGNQTLAAASLGISRRTLLRRLDVLDIARPRKRS